MTVVIGDFGNTRNISIENNIFMDNEGMMAANIHSRATLSKWLEVFKIGNYQERQLIFNI